MRAIFVIWLVCALLLCLFSGFVFNYNLDAYFGRDIPWYADCCAGTILTPINVSAAVIALILIECDFQKPLAINVLNDIR